MTKCDASYRDNNYQNWGQRRCGIKGHRRAMTKGIVVDKANHAFSHQIPYISNCESHFESVKGVANRLLSMQRIFRCSGRLEREVHQHGKRTINGAETMRKARMQEPAYLIAQVDGDHVLKSHPELKLGG